MHHIDKHINKNDNELILRLLIEWKDFIGTFYNHDIIDYIEQYIKNNNIKQKEYTINCNECIGYGYNRKFEEIQTNYIKVILDDNFDIITAYPDLNLGLKTNKVYDIEKNIETLKSLNDNLNNNFSNELWNKFLEIKSNTNYTIRYDFTKKHHKLHIINDNIKIVINDRLQYTKIETDKYNRQLKTILNIDEENYLQSLHNNMQKHKSSLIFIYKE